MEWGSLCSEIFSWLGLLCLSFFFFKLKSGSNVVRKLILVLERSLVLKMSFFDFFEFRSDDSQVLVDFGDLLFRQLVFFVLRISSVVF